ncbi:MAG TPA: ABC transporter ATP-binding protein [Verrucomicrobiae bacterium]|nr:ABC transporter ATP-binding protein [Verrucomicrobiae bacterium]
MTAATTNSDTVLHLGGITKRFGALVANDAISFELHRGEIVALLGENGAGKTTLMNILFGHYVADEGEIEVFGEKLPPGSPRAAIAAGIGMVHQHFTLADNLTVLDNIMLGTEALWRGATNRRAARQRLDKLAADFGLHIDGEARVADLSVGERQRVEILKVLYREAKILILDEPTAVLTPQESAALFETLGKLVVQGLSVIFISHKLNEVLAVSGRILVLRGGKLVAERRTPETSKAELATLMVGREIPPPKIEPQAAGTVAVRLSDVRVEGTGAALLDGISLELRAGEILGIAGVAGNGQSALADLLSGLSAPSSGTVELFGVAVSDWRPRALIDAGVGRIPEDRHAAGAIADMSVAENAIAEIHRKPQFFRHGFLDWPGARRFAQQIISDYDVKCPSPAASMRLLSGGNMQKLILGRVLSQSPRLVLANQPTRGLDVGAIDYVHRQLLAVRQAGGSVLLISEDLDELLSLADRVAVMYRGRLSAPTTRTAVTIERLGLMMAGQGLEGAGHAA